MDLTKICTIYIYNVKNLKPNLFLVPVYTTDTTNVFRMLLKGYK